MAKVSILDPIYNVEKYLRECLESLISQTLEDVEILCINDGNINSSVHSKEKVYQICSEYEELTEFLAKRPKIKAYANSYKLIKQYRVRHTLCERV